MPDRGWSRALLSVLTLVVVLSGSGLGLPGPLAGVPVPRAAAQAAPAEVIVVLEDGADPLQAARELGVTPTQVYRYVFTGFAGTLPAAGVTAARRSALVAVIAPDEEVAAQAQQTPTGVRRVVAADAWPSARPKTINADVAVLDSGIARFQNKDNKKGPPRSRDLNVRKGKNCIGRGPATNDSYGHGTHVAGTVGARDNAYGVVGVAPGVRLWSVKVLDQGGSGRISEVVCGLDWVFKNRNTIDVVNMSLGGPTRNTTSTCADPSPFHQAVCRVVNSADIPVVVSAGNQGQDANGFVPARFPEAITVGILADSDGRPGGLGGNCEGESDDTFAIYSNFGEPVDILAPGCRIRSTRDRGGTNFASGSSSSAPHVAGALALYLAANPNASAAQAESWLRETASVPLDDPDGLVEPPFAPVPNARVLWLEGVTP